MNLNQHPYRIYLRVWYVIFDVKNVKPPFLWLLGVIAPKIPLVKCECNYFCAKVRIWIDIRENMAQYLGC